MPLPSWQPLVGSLGAAVRAWPARDANAVPGATAPATARTLTVAALATATALADSRLRTGCCGSCIRSSSCAACRQRRSARQVTLKAGIKLEATGVRSLDQSLFTRLVHPAPRYPVFQPPCRQCRISASVRHRTLGPVICTDERFRGGG